MDTPTPNGPRRHWSNIFGRRFYTLFSVHNVTTDERTNLLRPSTFRLTWCDKFWLASLTLILIAGISVSTYLLVVQGQEPVPKSFSYVMRKEWTSSPTCRNATGLPLPVQRALLIPTNTSECWNETECMKVLRNLEEDHVERLNQSDMSFNFIVAGDGRIYEGRGWNCSSTYEDDEVKYLTVAFLGTYDDRPPTRKQVNGLEAFLEYAVAKDHLSSCYSMVTQNSTTTYIADVAYELEMKREKNIC